MKHTLDVDRLCKELKINQKELSEKLGVSEAGLSQMKTIPSKRWDLILNFPKNKNIKDFIVEVKTDQK